MGLLNKTILDNTFSLIIGGVEYKDCWESIRILSSMDNLAGTVSVRTTDFFEEMPALWNIKIGDSYIAKINQETIGIGYIDDINIDYSAFHFSIEFLGRDKTCDIVDCPFDGETTEWKNQTILKIVTNFCSPFGIFVSADPLVSAEVNTPVKDFNYDPGEPIADQIVTLCNSFGILPISLGDGKLTLTKATLSETSSDIIVDTNVKNASMRNSNKERYSKYIVKAEGGLSDRIFTTSSEQIAYSKETRRKAEFDDSVVKRFRPMIILSDTVPDSGKCLNRAKYEANIRAGKSREASYIIEGWTQVTSELIWRINKLVVVKDAKLQIFQSMLINSVEFTYNEGEGFTTALNLVNKETYSLSATAAALTKSGFDL